MLLPKVWGGLWTLSSVTAPTQLSHLVTSGRYTWMADYCGTFALAKNIHDVFADALNFTKCFVSGITL